MGRFLIILVFIVLFLYGCGASIFGITNEIDDDDGKSGNINEWISIARDYYQNNDANSYNNTKKLLGNLIQFRWNEMPTDQKFDVAVFYSTTVFNQYIPKKYDFIVNLEILVTNFVPTNLSFNSIDSAFIDNHIEVANQTHALARPVLSRLVPYSNEISDINYTTILIHLGSSLVISYASLYKGPLYSAQSNVPALKESYNNLLLQANATDEAIQELQADPTDTVKQAAVVTATNELCRNRLAEATNIENDLGDSFIEFNNYMDNTATPSLQIFSSFNKATSTTLKAITDNLDKSRSNFNRFEEGRAQTQQAKEKCDSGAF